MQPARKELIQSLVRDISDNDPIFISNITKTQSIESLNDLDSAISIQTKCKDYISQRYILLQKLFPNSTLDVLRWKREQWVKQVKEGTGRLDSSQFWDITNHDITEYLKQKEEPSAQSVESLKNEVVPNKGAELLNMIIAPKDSKKEFLLLSKAQKDIKYTSSPLGMNFPAKSSRPKLTIDTSSETSPSSAGFSARYSPTKSASSYRETFESELEHEITKKKANSPSVESRRQTDTTSKEQFLLQKELDGTKIQRDASLDQERRYFERLKDPPPAIIIDKYDDSDNPTNFKSRQSSISSQSELDILKDAVQFSPENYVENVDIPRILPSERTFMRHIAKKIETIKDQREFHAFVETIGRVYTEHMKTLKPIPDDKSLKQIQEKLDNFKERVSNLASVNQMFHLIMIGIMHSLNNYRTSWET